MAEVTRADKVTALVAVGIDPRDRVGWLDKGHGLDKYDAVAGRVAQAIADTRAASSTAPTYFASNHEAGDGQTKCTLCDDDTEESHALTACIENLRSERDALWGSVGRGDEALCASSAEVTRLEREVERLNACLETMATFQDQRAVSAREHGAFNVANSCAVFADRIRSGMPAQRIIGDGIEQVMVYEDQSGSGEFLIYGKSDVLREAAAAELAPTPTSAELHAIGAPPSEVLAICVAGYDAAVFAADWAVLTSEVRHLMPERLARIEAALGLVKR